jgi:hypothetical protein
VCAAKGGGKKRSFIVIWAVHPATFSTSLSGTIFLQVELIFTLQDGLYFITTGSYFIGTILDYFL